MTIIGHLFYQNLQWYLCKHGELTEDCPTTQEDYHGLCNESDLCEA